MITANDKIVWTAEVTTDSGDHYAWVYASPPSREQVIRELSEWEGAEDLDWYENTTRVVITQTTIRD